MANQITDGRTNVFTAETVTGVVDTAGTANGTLDNEIFYQGLNSVGDYCSNTRTGMLFDAGSVQSAWANDTFYLLFNSGIAGLLGTKANGGVTVRFCGNTITDFFEVYVAGKDDYPPAFSGGWVQFVVDIEEAYTAAVTNGDANTNTGGTPPTTANVRYVGVTYVTDGTMPRMADNTWLDQIARLPSGSAGIIVEGSNGGTTPWTWADIVTAATVTNKWGTARVSDGGATVLNTPIQFGINDATNHEFQDNNATILWDNQEYIADGFYKLSNVMGTGTNFVKAGVKNGTGNDATGSQGWTVVAASNGARWDMDFSDANGDDIDLFGCSFQHGGTFTLTQSFIEVISSLYIDCTEATITNSSQIANTIVNANTADGVAFMKTDDITDIANCSFNFSDGHAIELLTGGPAAQTSDGNRFAGYGATATNDAAIYNNSGATAKTISVLSPGTSGEHTYRNGTSASTTISQSVTVTITVKDVAGVAIQNAQTGVFATDDGTQIINGDTNASGVITTGYSDTLPREVKVWIRKASSGATRYRNYSSIQNITASGLTLDVTMTEDPNNNATS